MSLQNTQILEKLDHIVSTVDQIVSRMDEIVSKMDRIEHRMDRIEYRIDRIENWPANQIEWLRKFSCSFSLTNRKSSGFFYIDVQGEYCYPAIGTCFHSIQENNRFPPDLPRPSLNEYFNIGINPEAYNDIFSYLPKDYFSQNYYSFSFEENYDFFKIVFSKPLPKFQGCDKYYSKYMLNYKDAMKIGEKLTTYSKCNPDLQTCIGNYVGTNGKKGLATFDTIGEFSGALVSNGSYDSLGK